MNNIVKNEKKLDQFYTNRIISKKIIQKVLNIIPNISYFLEPSAGDGAFSDILIQDGYKVFSFDLDPKKEYIIKKDFFSITKKDIDDISSENICVIGNPPFGKNSSLAVKFFNHSAELSNFICFIVPKTFKKQSIHNRLNLFFDVIYEKDLPKNSFLFCEKEYDVPCVFQIWSKKQIKRNINKKIKTYLFDFVKKTDANLAIRRAGGNSGKVYTTFDNFSKQSNYFIKTNIDKEVFIELINSIDFRSIVSSTAGVRSLSKYELIINLEEAYERSGRKRNI